MASPPLLPSEVLRRVLKVARFNGMSVLLVAGLFALLSAAVRDGIGTVVCVLAAGSGVIELHGATLIRRGDGGGASWLVASQVCLLTVIVGYCGWQLNHVNFAVVRPLVITDQVRQQLDQNGLNEDEFLRFFWTLLYGGLASLTLLYQGGMAIYYSRRRAAIAAALSET